MSLTPASPREINLFQTFEQEAPELLQLACHVAYVPRVEPRLLRGIRLAFLPRLDALYEHQLWFSDLVQARNTSNFIFSPGMAGLLAQRVRDHPDLLDLEALWRQCQVLTRHWKPLDRLERDLYFFALSRDSQGLNQVYRDMLRLISTYGDAGIAERAKLLELARRIKYSTAILSDAQINAGVGRHLVNFAFDSLHDPGAWSDDVDPVRLPEWMASAIPERQGDRLAVELRHDAARGKNILYFSKPDSGQATIEFDTPLPARLHIHATGLKIPWVRVNQGSLFELDAESTRIEMTTRSGKHYRLQIDQTPEPSSPTDQAKPKLYMAFSQADESRAEQIQRWLKTQEIDVELIEERPYEPNAPITAVRDPAIRVLRLWSEGMQKLWSEWSAEQQADSAGSLLLQIDDIEAPSGFATPGQVVDIRNWSRDSSQQLALQVAARIGTWAKGEEPGPGSAPDEYNEERAALLAEIEQPETRPERRLEIGDRLEEIGDPRPGVGVIEIQVPEEEPLSGEQNRHFRQLLDELEDPDTPPERRLAIGDELTDWEGGDPRFGVGLDADGLPEIDWVKIPAGEFIYGEGSDEEKRQLEAFEIARYPVTNAQYQAFVDDGGYENERWWQGLEKPEFQPSDWPQGNRPKTDVDWFEATAFTRWLSERLGQTITLAHETQWERAARGQEGLAYPWGNEYQRGYANVNEKEAKAGPHYLAQTTAVGAYAQAPSPEGLLDMSGNVWEWCSNDIDEPDQEFDVPGSPVLRGGSWSFYPSGSRAVSRLRWHGPGYRVDHIGFRLLRSPTS